ncbi:MULTISPECIES: amidase [unclassified Variovorax]|uniref:amidase n=1 Tax=unclassified Variovorax TaxID=663243 RepID=UPI0032E5C30C
MTNQFSDFDATGLAELVRTRKASPQELAEDTIRKIESINPTVNAIVHKTYDRARMRATTQPTHGIFAGVPWLLKDISEAEGVPMTLGSRAMRGNVSQVSVPFVEATETAGLNILGVTNVPEFGLTESSENVLYGPTRNPWSLSHSAGGSSGGAAAAVAAGIVPMAHGNDGGGSLRIPASHCGLFTLKPSRGRTLSAHAHDYPFGIAYDGAISRSVRDNARLMSIVESRESGLPPLGFVEGPSDRKLTIGLLLDLGNGVPLDAEVAAAIVCTAKLCENLGHRVEPVSLPFEFESFTEAFMSIWMSMAALTVDSIAALAGPLTLSDHFEAWTLGLREETLSRGGATALLQAAAPVVESCSEKLDLLLQTYDVVLSPVCQGRVPSLGLRELNASTSYTQLKRRLMNYASFTPIHNACGTPAMSVPLGWDSEGLPIGSQFFARKGQEATLLGLAYELEAAQPWSHRRPTHFVC